MELGGILKQTGATARGIKRQMNDINREVMWLVGWHWHRDIRPKHFTHAGATEYGYTPRDPFYELHKLRVKGHTYPLVWSGESQLQTVKNATISATATSKGARSTVRMRAPTLNFRGRIHMRDELQRISVADIELSTEVARVNSLSRIKAVREPQTTTIE